MGLAEVIERPRNWQCFQSSLNDALSAADDGRFMSIGAFTNWDNSENNRRNVTPYNIVVERIFIQVITNALDDPSVNTITMRDDGADTTGILTMTLASGVGLLEATALNVAIAAGSRIGFRINSDSTGLLQIKTFGIVYRIVNPAA